MAAVTYPVGLLVDDAGAVLTAPVVTIAGVVDKAGVSISSPGAVVNGSGSANPISIDYDAELNGEAWIKLTIAQGGHTVTGANAAKALFATAERSQVASMLGLLTDASISLAPDTLSGTMSVYESGQSHIDANKLFEVSLSRQSTGQPFSFDRT